MTLQEKTTVRSFKNGSVVEYYITAETGGEAVEGRGSRTRRLFDDVVRILAERGISPIQEIVYGLESREKEILEKRRSAYLAAGLDPSNPITFLEGRPVVQCDLAGVRVWGVSGATVRTIAGPGRLWEDGESRLLYLTGMRGAGSKPAALQAKEMFRNTEGGLKAQGFAYTDVARTWIYLRDILGWYDAFNVVRNKVHLEKAFFGDSSSPVFPASTGIEAKVPGAVCAMDVLAISGKKFEPVLETARQGRAFSYRSAFSRAMVVKRSGARTIHISGTASIDSEGKSIHPGDPEGQCRQTLESVAAILEEQGGGLEDICAATLYCKDMETYAAYQKTARAMGNPEIPLVAVLADVCRPELLVELEAVAVVAGR